MLKARAVSHATPIVTSHGAPLMMGIVASQSPSRDAEHIMCYLRPARSGCFNVVKQFLKPQIYFPWWTQHENIPNNHGSAYCCKGLRSTFTYINIKTVRFYVQRKCLGTPDCKYMENMLIDFIWLNYRLNISYKQFYITLNDIWLYESDSNAPST